MSIRQANKLNRKLDNEEKIQHIQDYVKEYGPCTPLSVAWELQDLLGFTEGEVWRLMWLIPELKYDEVEGVFGFE